MGRENPQHRRRGEWRRATVALLVMVLATPAGVVRGQTADVAGDDALAAADAPAKAGPTKPLTEPGRIELHVKDEDLTNVVELLSTQYQLNIVASRNAKGKVTADLYNLTVEQALDAICHATGLAWVRERDVLFIETAEEAAAVRNSETRLVMEVFDLNYLSAEEAVKLITPALSAKGTTSVNSAPAQGIPSGASGDTGGNSYGLTDIIVVRDFPESIERIRAILKRMDRRPRQVLVEATILQITLNDETSLGVDFNTLAGIDFRDLSVTNLPVTDPTAPANVATTTASANLSPWSSVYTSGFATPGPGLNIGVITNNVALFINALETVTDTTILSNPKVLALNRQRGEVIVGQRLGYRTTTLTETTAVETVEFLDTGTQLIFRPFISDDGYVRLEIHPKVSTGDVVAGLPQETTTEVTCNIMVKDGHTIVIGGLFDETVSIGRSQVPGLGNVPGLGWLFRNKEDSSVRHEIIILLTPHIIDDEEASDALGKLVLDDARRRCLGMREGFTCFTRERITVGYLQEAKAAWQRYQKTLSPKDLDKAWWNVSLCLNVAPNNLDAMRLKDRVMTAREGKPYAPPNMTLWDSIQDRLRVMDKAKLQGGKAPADKPVPAAPSIPPPPAQPPVETPTPVPAKDATSDAAAHAATDPVVRVEGTSHDR
jgi:type IV pilus assembly protein PilQ